MKLDSAGVDFFFLMGLNHLSPQALSCTCGPQAACLRKPSNFGKGEPHSS